MRKLLLVFLVLLVATVMTGCSDDGDDSKKSKNLYDEYTVEMSSGLTWVIYVDKETDEMYLASPDGFDGGIAPMYEDDGSIMLWAENKDEYLYDE